MVTMGPWPCLAGAGAASLLAGILLWKRWNDAFSRAATLAMGVLVWIHASNAMAALDSSRYLMWRQAAFLGEIAFPVSLSYLSLSLVARASTVLDRHYRWRLYAMVLIAAGFSGLVILEPQLVLHASEHTIVFDNLWGRVIWSGVLLGLVLALSDLERLLRGLRDPLRYQLKYIIIGFGGLAGVALAQAAQLLVLPVWKPHYEWVNGLATVVCVGLMAIGFARGRMQQVSQKIYISHQALYTSFTLFIVGGYLIVVGLVAEFLQRFQWAWGDAVGMLFVFLAAVGFASVAVSRQARMELKHFIARNFFRAKHDYRAKWLEMTEAFASCDTTDHILDQYLLLLSQTFGAPRIGIWLRFDADDRYHQVRTVNTEPAPFSLEPAHPLVRILQETMKPLQFPCPEEARDPRVQEFLKTTQAMLCVPLQVGSQLIGFVTLSAESDGRPYEVDDVDLCRVMAHHVAMLLAQAKSTEERTAQAKWDAVAQFTAFYLHDLKNLASGLSLVVQNAQHYGNDPDFHASVIRTVTKTANRITELIEKLSVRLKSSGSDDTSTWRVVDINTLIHETVELLNGQGVKPELKLAMNLPPVAIHPEQVRQVLYNLVINAQQAVQESGLIEIRTAQAEDSIMVVVEDEGPGIPASQLSSLFHPFRSTKRKGMGIGLYQCKQIIEHHHGSIRVESHEGRGTSVLIFLPASKGETT